jgi:transglutaminase-like putative cysteine protease
VSDYLFAAPASGGTDSVEVNTHAWLEARIPAADEGAPAWVGADPTNRTLASARHVKIGHGRGYADVPPVRASTAAPGRRRTTRAWRCAGWTEPRRRGRSARLPRRLPGGARLGT